MKVSTEWLKEIIGVAVPGGDIADKIILNGMEVEKLIQTGIGKQNIVAVEILEVNKHPDADALSVTTVDAGMHGKKQIVTNVKDLKKGDRVLAALEGVKITDDFIIKKAKLRGVESEGMFVGYTELNIPSKSEGLIFLTDNTVNGTNYYEIAPFIDEIVDIELTSNRGDCLGMYGIGREISVLFKGELSSPDLTYKTNEQSVKDHISVSIETKDCSRYCGAVIKNINIKPSPLWLQLRLTKAGVRPINNVVDITNYIMLELNQPLHAFDYDMIADKKIIVRNAHEGETLTTLDGIERKLAVDDIVIADNKNGHCLGGIMGGSISEVSDKTVNIFLEAAFFNPAKIRRTSKRLGLRSDSSYRFERTTDIVNIPTALKRALNLFDKLGVGSVCKDIIDVYPSEYKYKTVDLDAAWINRKLGTDITEVRMKEILSSLDYKVDGNKITVPSWRSDVSIKEDISEEVARIFGYNNIIPTINPSNRAGMRNDSQIKDKKIREICYKAGCSEVFNLSYIGESLYDQMNLPDGHSLRYFVKIEEPLSDDFQGMRNLLLPGMLRTASFNAKRRNTSLSIFETGNISIQSNNILPIEKKCVSVLLGGIKKPKDHTGEEIRYDFYDIKGILEQIESAFDVKFELNSSNASYFHPYRQADIVIDGVKAGFIGQMHPKILDNFDIDYSVFVFELELNRLYELSKDGMTFSDIPRFPSSERDIAVIVSKDIEAGKLVDSIKSLKVEFLREISIFDYFTGNTVEDGYYSLGIKLNFNKMVSTITDAEIDPGIEKILKQLDKEFQARIR